MLSLSIKVAINVKDIPYYPHDRMRNSNGDERNDAFDKWIQKILFQIAEISFKSLSLFEKSSREGSPMRIM